MDEARVIGHAVGDVAEGEDMAVVPWKDWARLKLIEEKAAAVHKGCFDPGGPEWAEHYAVRVDEVAELDAALQGYRSDI